MTTAGLRARATTDLHESDFSSPTPRLEHELEQVDTQYFEDLLLAQLRQYIPATRVRRLTIAAVNVPTIGPMVVSFLTPVPPITLLDAGVSGISRRLRRTAWRPEHLLIEG
jgi:hypothetical protein